MSVIYIALINSTAVPSNTTIANNPHAKKKICDLQYLNSDSIKYIAKSIANAIFVHTYTAIRNTAHPTKPEVTS